MIEAFNTQLHSEFSPTIIQWVYSWTQYDEKKLVRAKIYSKIEAFKINGQAIYCLEMHIRTIQSTAALPTYSCNH